MLFIKTVNLTPDKSRLMLKTCSVAPPRPWGKKQTPSLGEPVTLRAHLFRGAGPGDGQLRRPCEKVEREPSAAPRISHHHSGRIKRGTLRERQRKVWAQKNKKNKKKNEKVKAAVWMCLIFIMAAVCVRSWPHSTLATIKRSISLYRNIRDGPPRF